MMRGINCQRIFENTEDHYIFLQCLSSAQEQYSPEGERLPNSCYYYAYALMSNHFHLLLYAKDDTVGNIVKRIASSYVYYFNKKYGGGDGHLFKERFRSEPCEDWSYFVTLLRYIHQNPIKAGLIHQVSDYEYTSWHEYLGKAVFFPLCNVPTVLRRISMKELSELVETPLGENISCLEYENERSRSISDDQVSSSISPLVSSTTTSFSRMPSVWYQTLEQYPRKVPSSISPKFLCVPQQSVQKPWTKVCLP